MTVADLIDWSGWQLNVPSGAVTGTGVVSPTEPSAIQTAIECPLALFLAPVVAGQTTVTGSFSMQISGQISRQISGPSFFTTRFENRTEPFVSSGGVTECWATGLSGYRTTISQHGTVTSAIVPSVAAVWASDYSAADATPQLNIYYSFYQPPAQ
jgi:hypothetical protein